MTTVVDPAPVQPEPGAPTPGSLTTRTARVAAVVVASLALVVVAVWAPLAARLTGEEVTLRVAPVDPMDPFRGAYVDLSYPDLPTSDPGDVELTEAELEAAGREPRHGIRPADAAG